MMSNWCRHDITLIAGERDFHRVFNICRENIRPWSEKYCTCEQLPGGLIHAQYDVRSTPRYDLPFEISSAIPGSIVQFKYDEPMMVIFGDLVLRGGHLLQLSERRDVQTWEWSAENGVLREYHLTYADPEDPYGDHSAHLVSEEPCVEGDLFGPVPPSPPHVNLLRGSPILGGESK
jgi:hypothetical protein